MKILIYALLLVLVFAGVGAYQLGQRGLLTRATYDSYFAPSEEEEKRALINPEPVGLASSINVSKQELRGQANDIEVLSERLEAQRKELDEERASIEERLEDLKKQGRTAAEKRAEALRNTKLKGLAEPMSDEQARLVKMYGSMPPDDAAALLDKMPDEMVAAILLQMRNRQAAQVMGELDKDKAAEVVKLLWSVGEAAPVAELAAAP
jgi:flagellar motility protein MotE (MotC chaperone)